MSSGITVAANSSVTESLPGIGYSYVLVLYYNLSYSGIRMSTMVPVGKTNLFYPQSSSVNTYFEIYSKLREVIISNASDTSKLVVTTMMFFK